MSKAITVSQFVSAINGLEKTSTSIKASLHTAALFIVQCKVYQDQVDAKSVLAIAYQALQTSLNGAPFKLESAQTWVSRNVKKHAGVEKFVWLKSDSDVATAKAKTRAAKTETKEEPKSKEEPKTETTVSQLRTALILKEKANRDLYINQIPAGKIKAFEQAYAAFIITIETILV